MADDLAWALDPSTSCGVGCGDPWGGPPIAWTFVGPGDARYPGFDGGIESHMPRCDEGAAPGACSGSNAHLHLGLELARQNQLAYSAKPPPQYPADSITPYVNVLVTDGVHDSTAAQVSAPLVAMHADGVTTHVFAVGDAVDPVQVEQLACWGSGGTGVPCAGGTIGPYGPQDQAALEQALVAILEALNFDPCCTFDECTFAPEPTTSEPDPVMPCGGSSSSGSSTGPSSDATSSAGSSGDVGESDTTTGVDDGSGSANATGSAGGEESGPASGPATAASSASSTTFATSGEGDTTGNAGALSRDACACSGRGRTRAAALVLAAIVALGRRRRR
jgi:hypothetical protein